MSNWTIVQENAWHKGYSDKYNGYGYRNPYEENSVEYIFYDDGYIEACLWVS